MNARCHRIVFNKARGVLMAVAETALAAAAGLGAAPAVAQIIADPTAPAQQQATVLMDANGAPLVNIQTPSAGGVSRNTWRQFDVQGNGVTLNNSRHSNPWLATGEAAVILNEVNSVNPSHLNGAITVNGARAQVIVANPAGIQVNGGKFINASRATLTTGTPVMEGGTLSGFRVQQGEIQVTGQGLDVRGVGYTELLSRAASIAGRIDGDSAGAISVVTGAQTVNYQTGQAGSPTGGAGPAPALAIDSSALGGMYAGSISLLATEAGVGVRNTGVFQADAQLVITADGRLENSGQLQAPVTSLATVSGDIQNSGTIKTTTLLSVAAGGTVQLQTGSAIDTGGKAYLQAGGSVTAQGASLSGAGDVTVLARDGITLTDTTVQAGNIHLETGAPFAETFSSIRINGGQLQAADSLTAIGTGHLVIDGQGQAVHKAGGKVQLGAGHDLHLRSGARIEAGQDALLTGGAVQLLGAQVSASGKLDLQAITGTAVLYAQAGTAGAPSQIAQLQAGGDLSVIAYQDALWAKGLQATGHNIGLYGNGTVSVTDQPLAPGPEGQPLGSRLTAGADVIIASVREGTDVELTASGIEAAGQVTLAGAGNVLLYASEHARPTVNGQSIRVQGGSIYGRSVALDAQGGDIAMDATTGTLQMAAQGDIRSHLTTTGNVSLRGERVLGLWDLDVNAGGSFAGIGVAGDIMSVRSTVTAGDALILSAHGAQNHWQGLYDGGSLALLTQTGHIDLKNTRLQTRQTHHPDLQAISGQLSVSSGAAMMVDKSTTFSAATDLSIATGSGDIHLNPRKVTTHQLQKDKYLAIAQDQLSVGRDLTFAARNGTLRLTGIGGIAGYGSSYRVDLDLLGDIRLLGASVDLQGARLRTTGEVSVVATDGTLGVQALTANKAENGLINTYWDRAEIAATKGIDLRASGDMNIRGLWAHTWGKASLLSGGNLNLSGVFNRWQAQSGTTLWQQHALTPSELLAGQGITLGALGGHLTLNGANVSGGTGDVGLQALGDVVLESAPEQKLHQTSTSHVERKWYGKKKVTTFTTHNESLVGSPVWIDGQNVEIKAGNNVRTFASQISARGDLHIEAGDEANYYAVKDQSRQHTTVSKSSSLWGIEYKDSTISDSRLVTTHQVTDLQSTGSFASYSGGDQTFQGTEVTVGGQATYRAGVGDKAREDAKIILEGVIDSITESRTFDSDSVVWMKQSGEGSVQETLRLPSFHGPNAPVFDGPVVVDLPEGDFKSQIERLGQQPGMAYLNDLAQRSDVQWRPVQLAFDNWQYEQEGLTGAGAALVAVAVAWATGGTGASLIGASNTSVAGMMANAAFTSLAAQASISFINNKGDIGQTLKDLGSSDVAKAAIAAALTAGVMSQMQSIPALQSLQGANAGFADKLTFNLINAGGRALTTAAIEGGDLEDALRGAILGGLIDTAHGSVAGQIKGMAPGYFKGQEASYLAHKLAHALAGCVAGAAAGGECRDGAIGAAVGEVVAGLFEGQKPSAYASDDEWKAYDAKVLAYSKIVAGGIAAYTGGDAHTAITTAETAVRHNFLTFDENQLRKQASEQCKAGNAQACVDAQRWQTIDTSRDDKVREVCSAAPASQQCADWRAFASLARDSYSGHMTGPGAVADQLAFRNLSDAQELHSIQNLIATTPYAHNVTASPHLRTLASIAADLTPIVGDIKGFHEAENPFDYALVMLGALGPVGDGAAAAIRAAKAAHEAGDVAQTAANLSKASGEAREAVQATFGLKFDPNTRTWTTPAGLDYGPGSIHGNRVKHVLDHTVANPSKRVHSVFSVPRADVLKLVDEAWSKRGAPVGPEAKAFIVEMGRTIGTNGETKIKIVIESGTSNLVTAHPI